MAIGRVPGAALLSNLDRQGLDLSFTTSSQTLAYLDFANFRLGINTVVPQEALDITGNILVTTGNVLTSANLTYDIGTVDNYWRSVYAGDVYSESIVSATLAGTLTTASQPNITTVGTLGSLDVTGNITADTVISNNIVGNISGAAVTVTGPEQPHITSVGNLTQLIVVGNITSGNVSSEFLTGTLLTSAQPNITTLGTLTGLTVDGDVTGTNIYSTSLYGTLQTAEQTNITTLGTLLALTVSGNIVAQSSIVPESNFSGSLGYADKWWDAVYASTVNATNLNGTILTANQPNITTLGNITVDSISTGGNVIIGGNINGATIAAEAFVQSGQAVLDTATMFNVTGDVTGTGVYSDIALTLVDTGVVAGIYGSADDEVVDSVPKITVDSKGRITNISNIALTQVGNVTFTDTTISTASSLVLNSANDGNITLNANGTGIVKITGNDAIAIPTGNTSVRPTTVSTGYLRYNTDLGTIEFYNGVEWTNNQTVASMTSQTINPDGVSDTFTLDEPATTNGVLVSINGTIQQPTTAYIVDGDQITFSEIPLDTDQVEVRAMSLILTSVTAISDGTTRVETESINSEIRFINGGTEHLKILQTGAHVVSLPEINVSASATPTEIDSYDSTIYRTARYTIQASRLSNFESYEVMVTHNGTNAFYRLISSLNTGTGLGTMTATISGSSVLLKYTAVYANTAIRMSKSYIIL